jgi:hypothetical protein
LRHFQRFRLIGLCGFGGGVLSIRRNTVIAGFVGFFPHQCGKLWNGKMNVVLPFCYPTR